MYKWAVKQSGLTVDLALTKNGPLLFYLNCFNLFPFHRCESHKVGAIKINYHLAYRQWVVLNFRTTRQLPTETARRLSSGEAGWLIFCIQCWPLFFHSYKLSSGSIWAYAFLMNCPQFRRPLFRFISGRGLFCFARWQNRIKIANLILLSGLCFAIRLSFICGEQNLYRALTRYAL